MSRRLRRVAIAVVAVLGIGCLVQTVGGSIALGQRQNTAGSRWLLHHLVTAPEHWRGYVRTKFGDGWVDVGNGCDVRDDVLMRDARIYYLGSDCALSGTWVSPYDGVVVHDPGELQIDHLVPLAEAWQSGAWRWTRHRRVAYYNDLGYRGSLKAVTIHENESKGDQEPTTWLPARQRYRCHYTALWVAVKWRWHLTVNAGERAFLRWYLRGCGWPRVPYVSRTR